MTIVVKGKITNTNFNNITKKMVLDVAEHTGMFKTTGNVSITLDWEAICDLEKNLGESVQNKSLKGKTVEINIE